MRLRWTCYWYKEKCPTVELLRSRQSLSMLILIRNSWWSYKVVNNSITSVSSITSVLSMRQALRKKIHSRSNTKFVFSFFSRDRHHRTELQRKHDLTVFSGSRKDPLYEYKSCCSFTVRGVLKGLRQQEWNRDRNGIWSPLYVCVRSVHSPIRSFISHIVRPTLLYLNVNCSIQAAVKILCKLPFSKIEIIFGNFLKVYS